MSRTATRLSPEARQEKLDAAHQQLVDALTALTTSADWCRWLDTMGRFHHYSAGNCLMILMQRPEATRVAGFHAWKVFGRRVRKGAKGIAIWAPVTRRVEQAEDAEPESPATVRCVGFRLAHVFDVADTEGDPLPVRPGRPRLLDGEAPEGLMEHLEAQVRAAGFALSYEPVIADEPEVNGHTDFLSRQVTVATADRTPAGEVKTLAHELAHVLLHGPERVDGRSRARAEVEAESVAYLVCAAHGLDSTDYSLGYVAGWSGGDVDQVLATAMAVQRCARQILGPIDAAGSDGQMEDARSDGAPADDGTAALVASS